MKVLIIESENYLAVSLATKLNDLGFSCEIADLMEESYKKDKYDVILLSTSMIGLDFKEIIKTNKNSIIILMINSINNDVMTALKLGADDYILKPIILDEIVRKIKIFDSYKKYKILNKSYEELILSMSSIYKIQKIEPKKIKLPLFIICASSDFACIFVFLLAKSMNAIYEQISANDKDIFTILENTQPKNIVFIKDFHEVDLKTKTQILSLIKHKNIIISSNSDFEISFNKIALNREFENFPQTEIMLIEEYVKFIINKFQDIYPDTELSRKLGISRKSLWEKRKKYGISKK